jgi:hypothetical protein
MAATIVERLGVRWDAQQCCSARSSLVRCPTGTGWAEGHAARHGSRNSSLVIALARGERSSVLVEWEDFNCGRPRQREYRTGELKCAWCYARKTHSILDNFRMMNC